MTLTIANIVTTGRGMDKPKTAQVGRDQLPRRSIAKAGRARGHRRAASLPGRRSEALPFGDQSLLSQCWHSLLQSAYGGEFRSAARKKRSPNKRLKSR